MDNLLTIEQLISFCKTNNMFSFNSNETGKTLSVQIPTTFTFENNVDDKHRGMTKLKFRLFHTGLNRNGSFIKKEVADIAMNTINDRPVLAHIHKLDTGEYDFESHNIELKDDGIEYVEKQVGSFSSEPAFYEYDEDNDRYYVCGYAYISNEYTKAVEILKRKNGTKTSAELTIEEMSYNAKDNYLSLDKFYLNGETLLGCKSDGTEIQEGMEGSRADIIDFSNNTVDTSNNTDVNIYNSEKGGTIVEDVKEILSEELDETKTMEDETENTPETDENVKDDENVIDDESTDEKADEVDEFSDNDSTEVSEESEEKVFSKTFELSHDDIRIGLYNLLEELNVWCYIISVFDNHFIYECGKKIYSQSYAKDDDNLTLIGERVEVFAEFLTKEELDALTEARDNYFDAKDELEKYKAEPKKLELLNSDNYSFIANTDEFKELSIRENYFNLSIDKIKEKADEILLNYAKSCSFNFSKETIDEKKIQMPMSKKKQSRYGNLFSRK